MIDQKKRTTLKAIGIATAATLIPSQALLASTSYKTAATTTSANSDSLGVSHLKIEIITSVSAKYNTVIFSNLTDQALAVKHFKPGSVIWGDQYLDLNALRGPIGLNLAARSAMNLHAHRQQIQHTFQSEYIWADDAVTPINTDSSRILLGAFLADGYLHAYPIPTINKIT